MEEHGGSSQCVLGTFGLKSSYRKRLTLLRWHEASLLGTHCAQPFKHDRESGGAAPVPPVLVYKLPAVQLGNSTTARSGQDAATKRHPMSGRRKMGRDQALFLGGRKMTGCSRHDPPLRRNACIPPAVSSPPPSVFSFRDRHRRGSIGDMRNTRSTINPAIRPWRVARISRNRLDLLMRVHCRTFTSVPTTAEPPSLFYLQSVPSCVWCISSIAGVGSERWGRRPGPVRASTGSAGSTLQPETPSKYRRLPAPSREK
ncbi:hypothetical protein LZ30DRAFT_210094 [Colletotrichum cereale]|nr:hypothetical protein LZ30DRAFT_210094 [Colletotrichum cereale]